MDYKKEDRRIKRTKKMLKQGLALMMAEKNFKDITVKDITDRADLNRSTFYLHYTDTYDLLEKLENDMLDDFQNMIEANLSLETNDVSLKPMFDAIASYIIENSDTCKIIFENKASGDFFVKFRKLIERNGTKIINKKYPSAKKEKMEYFFAFITYGTIGLIKQWINNSMLLEKQEMVSLADGLIDSAARSMK